MKFKRSELYLAFVGMKNAYDNVPHWELWEKLIDLGIEENLTTMLQETSDCTAVYGLNDHRNSKAETGVPTLPNPVQHINSLLKALNGEGPGLRLSIVTPECQEVYTKISCLAF